MQKIYTVYKITNIINGKCYIGQTDKTAKRRFTQHKCKARNGYNKNRPIHMMITARNADFLRKKEMNKCESCYFLTWYLTYLLSLQQYEKHWYRNGEVYTGEIHMHGNNGAFTDGHGNIVEWR